MSILAMAAGLLLVFMLHIGFLAYRLLIGDLRLRKLDLYLVLVKKTADHYLQMQIAHAVQQRLFVLRIVYNLKRLILVTHLLQRLGNLIHVSLVFRPIPLVCIRRGNLCLSISDNACFCGERIASSGRRQLRNGADIACVKLLHFNGLAAL